MDIHFDDEKQEEVMITRVCVVNSNTDPIPLPDKYRCMFHGDSCIRYGRHTFRFPITNLGYKRLVSSFQSDFMRKVRVEFGFAGFDEV